MSLTLRPVVTPGSNPDVFYQRKALSKAQAMPRLQPEPQQFLKPSIPNGMAGPNIYSRCLLGLRSGIKEEQDFALHHLVKVSYERGDKYKFDGFPLLAESLIEKALEVAELIYGMRWRISYNEVEGTAPDNTINGAFGTPNLLDKVRSLSPTVNATDPESAEFSQRLDKLNEAALVIRNMVILEENAVFVSKLPLFRDFLTIAINLPSHPQLTEYRHYALEMAEQVTRYWSMTQGDPLYLSLLQQLESHDRGMVLPAMRAINRIGIETPEVHRLTDVPLSTIERLFSFVLLESDDVLLEATLDFVYEFTAIPENVTYVLSSQSALLSSIIPRLSNLLLHNASSTEEKILNRTIASRSHTPPPIPMMPQTLYNQLLGFPEPQRSSSWLRCCFEESPQDDITQIAIWQAYQSRFAQNAPIAAADFIKNVSNTFASAQAQVINGPQPRFIIKGIKPRRVLVDPSGRPLFKCLWEIASPNPYSTTVTSSQKTFCSQWHRDKLSLWSHILNDHLGIQRGPDGRFDNGGIGTHTCRWTGCMRSSPFSKPMEIGMHVRAHLPETADAMRDLINELAEGKAQQPEYTRHKFYYTAMDERGHPCGIPFMSVMVMRNLARYANKHAQAQGFDKGGVKLMERLFGTVKTKVFEVVAVNRTLRGELGDLLGMIERGVGAGDAAQQKTVAQSDEEMMDGDAVMT